MHTVRDPRVQSPVSGAAVCVAGTGNPVGAKCYAAGAYLAAWSRTLLPSGNATVTMIAATSTGSLLLYNSTNGTDVSCNTAPTRLAPSLLAYKSLSRLQLMDLNGDGASDVVALTTSGVLTVAFNSGSGSFTTAVTVATSVGAVCAFDIDADEDVDFALFGAVVSSVMLNNGHGGFSNATAFSIRFVGNASGCIPVDMVCRLSGVTGVTRLLFVVTELLGIEVTELL